MLGTARCCHCEKTTKDVADEHVVLCDICDDTEVTEIHLRCLNPSLESAPEEDWYCPKCVGE